MIRAAAGLGVAALIGLGLVLWSAEGGRVWMSAWAMVCG